MHLAREGRGCGAVVGRQHHLGRGQVSVTRTVAVVTLEASTGRSACSQHVWPTEAQKYQPRGA